MAQPRTRWRCVDVTVPHGASPGAVVTTALERLTAEGWEPVHVTPPAWRESSPAAIVLVTVRRVEK